MELKGLLGECVRRTAVEKACGLRFQPRGTEGEVYPFLGWFREGGIGELGKAVKIPGMEALGVMGRAFEIPASEWVLEEGQCSVWVPSARV